MPPTYVDRLRLEGFALAGCGLADVILLLALSSQARRWPLSTLGQLAVVAVLVGFLGPRSVRKALDRSVEVAPDAVGSGEPTPLWQMPLIVAGLTLLVGLPSAGGWDAGVRIGEPAEVARAIAFLAGPASAYVHGQVLRVDGGFGLMSQSLATGGEA